MVGTSQRWLAFVVVSGGLLLSGRPVMGTWSIVLVDTRTKEIAVGSATCLVNFDLQRWLPVAVVGVGGACAQSQVDSTGQNRLLIWNRLMLGTPPLNILTLLAQQDTQHQRRQYGIVDVSGRAVTFTGTQTSAWAGGATGQQGTMVYAIQGNILTGAPVVQMAEAAVLNTPGDLPEKLMAGMLAARAMGGDGRCSCPGNPTGCGSPPPNFTKSAHVGFMIDARIGDTNNGCTTALGCAAGGYFLDLNIAGLIASDPDPVFVMADRFQGWRVALRGRPDAVQSIAVVSPPSIPAHPGASATLHITLIDWKGLPVTAPLANLIVAHELDSASSAVIGPAQSEGDGIYTIVLTASSLPGVNRFRITANDGIRSVVLMPSPQLDLLPVPDADGDGDADLTDFAALVACLTPPDAGPISAACAAFDAKRDGDVDLRDVAAFANAFTGP